MKRKLLLKLLILSFGAFIWMSHSGGRAADKNQGSTGAPGDGNTCSASSCHGNTVTDVDLVITFFTQNFVEVSEYVGGETYKIRVEVNHVSGALPEAFGFQMVALIDSNNQSTDSFSGPGSNVQIATASSTGRQYAEQTEASTSNTFFVEWTAPAAGSGDITFYAAGNGVDNNGSKSGDGGDETTLTITEEGSSSNNEIAEKWELSLFPNPVVANINLKGNADFNGSYTATIIDVAGRAVVSRQVIAENGQMSISSSDLNEGNYTLMLQNKEEVGVIKFIKL